MYNDNKHPTDWPRGRRPDFQRERDGHYPRQDPYYTQPYSPKRRKLESGEAEPIEFDSSRRVVYPRYDSSGPRTQVSRPYYVEPYETVPRHDYGENPYYPRGEYGRTGREYTQPMRRYPEAAMDSERSGDPYGRRNYDPLVIGRKRPHPDVRYAPPRREFENRVTPLSPNTPIKHLASPALTVGSVRDIYDPLPSANVPPKTETLPTQPGNKTIKSPNSDQKCRQSPQSDEEGTLSKKEIIEKMDQLDTQINQKEEEIERFKKLKTLWQRQTDKSKLSDVDRILLSNQEVANENAEYMKLFQAVDVVSKTKADLVHTPDNLHSHSLKRPVMMRHMKKAMLEAKEKNKKLAIEFEIRRQKWVKHVRSTNLTLPKPVALLNNALSPVPFTPPAPSNSRGGRRSRGFSDTVRSEAEFTQVMQQLSETEHQDPNVRYTKTLAKIPPLIVDPRERARTFYDHNRFVENCAAEYQQYQLTNPWNSSEQEIFLRKYISHPKQFAKIASFLPNKSIEEVICYYFKNKHRLNLKGIIEEIQAKKRPQQRSRSALRKPVSAFVTKEVADLHRNNDSTYWSAPRERRSIHAAIPTSRQLSRERSTPTRKTSKSRPRNKPASPPRKPSSSRKNLTVQSATVDQLCFVSNVPSPWTEMEVNQFKIALVSFGTDFKAIADFIGSKNHWECRSFYFNFKEELSLAELISNAQPKKDNAQADPTSYSLVNGDTSVQEKASIASLLNSPVLPATKEPQNWVLEEPVIPPTALPAVNALVSLGSDNKSFTGSNIPTSGTKDFGFQGLSVSTVNIRHSFDSFSPLENTETKSSVTWCVSDISTNPLRHSSAEVSFGYSTAFPSSLVHETKSLASKKQFASTQLSSVKEEVSDQPVKAETVKQETVEVEAYGGVIDVDEKPTKQSVPSVYISKGPSMSVMAPSPNVEPPIAEAKYSVNAQSAMSTTVSQEIESTMIKPVHPYSVVDSIGVGVVCGVPATQGNSVSAFSGAVVEREKPNTDTYVKKSDSECTDDSDDDLTLHIITDPDSP